MLYVSILQQLFVFVCAQCQLVRVIDLSGFGLHSAAGLYIMKERISILGLVNLIS